MIRVIAGTIVASIFIVTLGLIALVTGGSHSLNAYLTLSGILFAIGMFGFLARRNAISMLMAIELMLNAVNLAFIGFASFMPETGPNPRAAGSVIALLVMAVAAGEATVGLSIILAIFRNKRTPLVDEYDTMRQ